MICDLFTTADLVVARYLRFSLEQLYVLRNICIIPAAAVCVARYLSFSLQQAYVLRDISDVHYSRSMCCEISEMFSRAHVCVARYLSLFPTADVRVARYLNCALQQNYVLRDI